MDLVAFLATPTGLAVKGLLVGAFLVWALGVLAALRDGTFDLSEIATFVRSTLLGRVFPVTVVLLTGYAANDSTITTAGLAVAAVVAADMIGSALDSIKQLGLAPEASAKVNQPPS